MPAGPFAGIVFNRPIDQVLSYHVPTRLERIIRPGQRVRVPLGQSNKLTVGYCVTRRASRAGGHRSSADQGRGRGAGSSAAHRCEYAGLDPLDR